MGRSRRRSLESAVSTMAILALCTSPWYVIYYTAVIDPKECGEEQKAESGKHSKYNGHSCIVHISLVCYILYSYD